MAVNLLHARQTGINITVYYMGIMDYLGFSSKRPTDSANANNGGSVNNNTNTRGGFTMGNQLSFNDDTPRKDGESRIYNLIILDESGSMGSIYNQALTGCNETIQTIRNAAKDDETTRQMLVFVTFDSGSRRPDVRAIIGCEPIENVKDIDKSMYHPSGCTPLYDAMGFSIDALREVVKDGDNVLVTVITDGYENSSCHYSASMVKEMVESLRTKGWVFTYIGANQNSVEVAGGLGIRQAMDFSQTDEGATMMFEKMNACRSSYYRKAKMAKMMNGPQMDLEADFFSMEDSSKRVTPDNITTLAPGEIFVFGSNLDGAHVGGAARFAVEHFGAVMGQGVGLQGQSYAIPTMQGGVSTIRPYVQEFIRFAERHPEMTFYVTRIGCGIAGFRDEEIACLFAKALPVSNIYLPASFWKVINYMYNR